jgi:hypothetical protein
LKAKSGLEFSGIGVAQVRLDLPDEKPARCGLFAFLAGAFACEPRDST